MKKSKEGITSQKIDSDNAITGLTSFVSRKSQIIPRNETKGKDARIPPIIELRFEISEINAIISAEIRVFKTKYILAPVFSDSLLSLNKGVKKMIKHSFFIDSINQP
jgi:hypothetical protein